MRRWALLCVALGCEATSATTADSPAATIEARADSSSARVIAPADEARADSPTAPVVVAPVVVAPAVSIGGVPMDPAALRGWLQGFAYREWTPQTEIRATGEHGGERLYFNRMLAASMQAGAAEHPIGSAAVRELYSGDLKTLKGFALMHKTAPSGPTAEGWYWYEIFGTTAEAEPTVAQPAAPGCVGCHSHAVDFVHSPDTRREDPQPLL